MKIKVKCYDENGRFKRDVKKITNLDTLNFTENINGGQGNLVLELGINYDSKDYLEGDFLEFIVYDENYRNGLLKYSGFISSISRFFIKNKSQGIKLDISGLVLLLSDEDKDGNYKYQISKNYNGTLKDIIDEFISDFHLQKNITSNMQFLGNSILKNGVNSTNLININIEGNFFLALEKIFENKEFIITKNGTIKLVSENNIKHILKKNNNILEMYYDENNQTEIKISNYEKNIEVGDKIKIQNIDDYLNLNNEIINKIDYSFDEITIFLGKTKTFQEILT